MQRELDNAIRLHGVQANAETVITALATNGFLSVHGSQLHGPDGLTFGSVHGTATAENMSRLSTKNTAIDIGAGAAMQTQGNAQVRQNPDGSIDFRVGQ